MLDLLYYYTPSRWFKESTQQAVEYFQLPFQTSGALVVKAQRFIAFKSAFGKQNKCRIVHICCIAPQFTCLMDIQNGPIETKTFKTILGISFGYSAVVVVFGLANQFCPWLIKASRKKYGIFLLLRHRKHRKNLF